MCKINGKKLEEIREGKGLTRKELAQAIGVTPAAIAKYETEKNGVDDKNLEKICLALKISKGDVQIDDISYSVLHSQSKVMGRYKKSKRIISMTPIKLENWIAEHRIFSSAEEKAKVKSAIKNSFKLGNKKYILIDPLMVHIPEWQRDTYMPKVEEIKENYSEDKFEPIKAYEKEAGVLNVADGAHRLTACIKRNLELSEDERDYILVEILNCTEQEAMMMFLGQSTGRKNMTVSDMYRAGVKANIPEYTEFKDMCESNNIQITSELNKLDNPIGKITPSRSMLRITNKKRNLIEDIINLIFNLNWCGANGNPFTLRTFKVLMKLYSAYGEEGKEKLLTNCKGAAFYEAKIAPVKSNAELYDILVEEISK